VNSFTVNRTTKSETKNYNLELNYDNGGNFTSKCGPSAPTATASA
jgi:iron complex outermembrane receptor protein